MRNWPSPRRRASLSGRRPRLLREHGGQRRPPRVFAFEKLVGVGPAALRGEVAGVLLGGAGAQPDFVRAGRAAECEGRQGARDDGRRGHGEAERVGHEQAERLVAEEAAEAVRPARVGHGVALAGGFQFPDDRVVVEEAAPQRVEAELDARLRVVVERGAEAVDAFEQAQAHAARERGRPRLLDAAGRVARRQLDDVAEGHARHAAVVHVEGLVDDDEKPLRGEVAHGRGGLGGVAEVVAEGLRLGVFGEEGADVDSALAGATKQRRDGLLDGA